MKRLWNFLFGRREPEVVTVVVPVMVENGEAVWLRTQEQTEAMRARWQAALRGHGQDPRVRAVVELIQFRITQASGQAQTRQNHAHNVALVSYANGEAAGLNDLLMDVLRMTAGQQGPR